VSSYTGMREWPCSMIVSIASTIVTEVVRVTIAIRGTEVPIDYRMLKKGDRWLVYDVSIEGVSLVSNYRTQFNKIIQTSSYAELIKKMKSKQGELISETEKPAAKPKTQ